ncbi:MAG: CPBP family intramembrane metalloprotease [Microthrixaceae bacterium]|nr:CPBP family intramembrane metalloprotease [Microthrixaceae bacterium]
MSAPPLPPPGWHPDPWGHAPLRWWDGAAWSPWVTQAGDQWNGYEPEGERRWFPPIDTIGWPAAVLATVLVALTIVGNFVATAASESSEAVAGVAGLVILAVGIIGFPLAAFVASRSWGSGRLRQDLGLGFAPVDLAIAPATAAVMFGLVVGLSVTLQALGVPQASNLEGFEDRLTTPVIVFLLVLAGVLAPITEELLFRGVLMRGLSTRWGPATAIVGQGVVFGLAHLIWNAGWGNVGLVLPLTGVGVVLGWVTRATGRLGAGMVAHSLYNVTQIALLVATTG